MDTPPKQDPVLAGVQEHIDPSYTLVETLGVGGMARVFRAWDSRLARSVAVKVPHDGMAGSEELRARFLREAQALAQVAHPNVIRIHACPESPSSFLYMVTELVDGWSLADWLESHGAMPWEVALALAERSLAGLALAHDRGVLHRDLKPSNILISKDGVPKLADFGLARLRGAATITRADAPAGTLRYLAPETIDGPSNEPTQDIFAMGCVLYEAIAGRPAFDQQGVAELLNKLVRVHCPPLDQLAPGTWPECVELVRRAMAANPDERFASAESMRAACETVLASVGISAAGALVAAYVASAERRAWIQERREQSVVHLAERARLLALDGREPEARALLDRIEMLAHPGPVPVVSTVQPHSNAPRPADATRVGAAPRFPEPGITTVRPVSPGRFHDLIEASTRVGLVLCAASGAGVAHLLRLDPLARSAGAAWPALAAGVPVCLVAAVVRRGSLPRRVALGCLLGMLAVAALLPAEFMATLVCYRDYVENIRELLVMLGWTWIASTLATAALLAFEARDWKGAGWSIALASVILSVTVARDLHAASTKRASLLKQAIEHLVPPRARPIKVGAYLGHSLPRHLEQGCSSPPASSKHLVDQLKSSGLDLLVVHLRQADLSAWHSLTVGGVAPSPAVSALDRELLAAVREWKGEVMLTCDGEYRLQPSGLSRAEIFAAHTRMAAAALAETGARSIELPSPDFDRTPATGFASPLNETVFLLEQEARELRRLVPGLKIGVTARPTWSGTDHQADAGFLLHMASLPWIDWVGAQAYGASPALYDISRLVAALRERRLDGKFYLFTGGLCMRFARPPWRTAEDAAWVQSIGRWARGRGVAAWIHEPGATFSTYGWWYGSRAAAGPTAPLESFLSFGRPWPDE